MRFKQINLINYTKLRNSLPIFKSLNHGQFRAIFFNFLQIAPSMPKNFKIQKSNKSFE